MGFFTYWYRKQLKKDFNNMKAAKSSNEELLQVYRESFYFNLQKFNDIFAHLTKKCSRRAKPDNSHLRLVLIGPLRPRDRLFLDAEFQKSAGCSQAVLFFKSFGGVEQFFECLFEMDPEVKSQKYISNFVFYYLGKASSKAHFLEILNFLSFFERFKFNVKLNTRREHADHFRIFLAVSSLLSVKNLHFLDFHVFVDLFFMNI